MWWWWTLLDFLTYFIIQISYYLLPYTDRRPLTYLQAFTLRLRRKSKCGGASPKEQEEGNEVAEDERALQLT